MRLEIVIHEEILMLFHSEKFYGGGGGGGGIAIIESSSRSRSPRVHMELTWTQPGPDLD